MHSVNAANNTTKKKDPKKTKKVEADADDRTLTKLLDQALKDCVDDTSSMHDAPEADCTAIRPLALKLEKVYKPCALQIRKTELMEGVGHTHGME